MSRRLLVTSALIASSGALGCADPAAGVHVIVTMDDADFSDEHLFDHLTFTARIGERRADACLYPADAVERAVPIDDTSPNACADARTQAWTGPPTAESWALEGKPRTINVEAEAGEEVEISVTGGLGGRLGTVRGAGSMIASSSFPELTIRLTNDAALFPAGCGARLEPSFPEEFDANYKLCEAALTTCPATSVFLTRSAAVSCLDDGTSRVRNAPGLTCGLDDGEPAVWRTPALPTPAGCVRVFVRGRFARCKSGDPLAAGGCARTTACTPKPIALWSRDKLSAPKDFFATVPMECLPPIGVSMTWSVLLDLPKESIVGLAQSTDTASDDACFVDVEAIAATSKECLK
ncbi:MAG: hypothetical protein U0441_13075 [Polyangiaceae bacterium]